MTCRLVLTGVTVVAGTTVVWLLGLVALVLYRLEAVIEQGRASLRWMARARRGSARALTSISLRVR